MTTTSTTHIDHRPASRHGPLRALAAVGAVAVATVGFLAAIDGDERREPPPDRPAVQAEAAERVAADRALADVAAAEHLAGLSSGSLRPVGGNGAVAERVSVERALARVAIAEGLTGLSPLSLRPIDG